MSAVVLMPYAADWPDQFARVRNELLAALDGTDGQAEHIGSTAVPGLIAKPVLDVLLGAATLARIEAAVPALARRGYRYVPRYETELPMRRYFVRDADDASLRVHVHGVVTGSPLWREHLAFRDALRADPALIARYQALKQDLATRFAEDKAAYTAAEAPFIRGVIGGRPNGSMASTS